MRGSPLMRALAVFLVLLFLGWPLWRLTHEPAKAASSVVAVLATEPKEVALELLFTTPAHGLKIMHLGKEIRTEEAPAQEFRVPLRLPYPEQGIDLQFEFTWPGETPAAMRARLTDPAGVEHEKTIWGKGEVSEVLAFP